MKVIKTENAGFCFGVRRSLDLLDEAIAHAETRTQKAVMLGPIIHNPRLIEQYNQQGVRVVSIDKTPAQSVVVVRSHGITGDDEQQLLDRSDVTVVDTTCPFVKRIYELVSPFTHSNEGVVILGHTTHAEVQAIVSRVKVDHLVITPEELDNDISRLHGFMDGRVKVLVVAQTTSQPSNYSRLLEILRNIARDTATEIVQENTVCNATNYRQRSAREVAREVDAMVVIGGFNSSNTHKLFLVVSEILTKVWHVESADDFRDSDLEILKKCETVGITAGASTPDDQIEELQLFLEQL